MKKQLMDRYQSIDLLFNQMNQEAMKSHEIPFVRRDAFVHYCNVQSFLHAYTRKLRPDDETYLDWANFVYEDTLQLKSRIGSFDLYAFTFHYLKSMAFRTGNLDTPDDCVEILNLDLFLPYKAAREKEWKGEILTDQERMILDRHFNDVLRIMKNHLPKEVFSL